MKKIILSLVLCSFLIIGFSQTDKPKYVFLFIGDGMGVNQVYATELYLSAQKGMVKDTQMLMNTFPVNANMTTYSANSYVTCSSAAGTAMATGFKTNNGVLGKSPDLKTDYETISVKAKRAGYKVGILSSVMIDHATPASFYAHQNSRDMYYEIGMELPKYNVDFFGGGGIHYPKGESGNLADTYENAKKYGYTIVKEQTAFNRLKKGDEKVIAINPKRYPLGEFYWAIDNQQDDLTLADFTQKGIELLENPKGFFMMVEGGKIDWACHSNDAVSMIYEVIAFNDAVKVAYDFYTEHPNETLIIVTADHETGSMFMGFDYTMNPHLLKYQKISAQEFKRKMVKLNESGNEVSFEQVLQLIFDDLGLGNEAFGLKLTKDETQMLNEAYRSEFKNHQSVDPDADYWGVETKSVADIAIAILNKKAGIGWGTGDHSGMPVPVHVIGAGQQEFTKYFDNIDLPRKMEKLLGL